MEETIQQPIIEKKKIPRKLLFLAVGILIIVGVIMFFALNKTQAPPIDYNQQCTFIGFASYLSENGKDYCIKDNQKEEVNKICNKGMCSLRMVNPPL